MIWGQNDSTARGAAFYSVSGLLLLCGLWPIRSMADDEIRLSAKKLVNATVTLRAAGSQDFLSDAEGRSARVSARPIPDSGEITVCSGTCVGENLLLSFGCMPVLREDRTVRTEYRITFPAGGQATARPRVVDQHSGLVLLEIEGGSPDGLTALELADELPDTGGEVLTAAAAGVEEPLVSSGVLSGVDRLVPGAELPPLLVCDISTNAASSGAGLVDQKARLVGIVAAASLPGENFGWSYAIPLKYIRRVLDAQQEGRLVVLARMRPTLGIVLGPGEQIGTVVVQHVVAGGPGEDAGLAVGDRIAAIEGRQVRSVYQAGAILRKHLPGERITLSCISPAPADGENAGDATDRPKRVPGRAPVEGSASSLEYEVEVVLGAQLETGATSLPTDVQAQTIKARFTGPTDIELSNTARSYQFSLGPSAGPQEQGGGEAQPAEGVDLRDKLQEYEQLIDALRKESERQREQLARREQMVQALQQQLGRLRQEVSQLQATGEQAE